ncbi:MAG: hypothetical protein ABIJ82_04140 [Patescibacteria group bacterium]|nr:hypothetical protein [Patescibacteria group bacterium]MBU1952634.1 hypothetical protein [Patescibacteria group bacterium]
MLKKLTAKTQELNPKLPQYSNSFSKCLTIKPETQELLLKKGTLYIMFDLSGGSNFDTELVCKVVYDVLHDSYFNSESISPIQSMERSILETKEKILQLSADTNTTNPQRVVLNVMSAVLWGNVLYIVKFGSAKCYTVKGGGVVPMEMISEGNFSTSSKVVDEDEVLIFCTDPFEESVPPEKLLSSSLSESDLDPNQSCLLMRLLIDTSFSQDEVIDFGLGTAVSQNKIRVRSEKVVSALKDFFEKIADFGRKLSSSLKLLVAKLIKRLPRRKATIITNKLSQISKGGSGKLKGWAFLGGVATLLAISVFFTIRSSVFKNKKKLVDNTSGMSLNNQSIASPTQPQEDKSKDEQFKISRINPEVFYDIKIAEPQSEPTDIQIVGTQVVVVDRTTGKMFVSDTQTPNFKVAAATFPGIKSLSITGESLSFNDTAGYKTFDLKTMAVGKSYEVEGLSLTFPYAGFVYALSNDTLTKETEKAGVLEGTVWAKNPDFSGARSMTVAFNIYILKSNGELVSYSTGTKTSFAVSGLENPFSNTSKAVADADLKYIYVADRGNKSIVLLDDEGNLIKQYKYDTSDIWNDIRSISVSLDEKTLFVLNGSKVYKVDL